MDYNKEYKECKARYIAEKNKSLSAQINKMQESAHQYAYDLLCYIETTSVTSVTNKKHNIVTAESLTAGLIFSTLVDIPQGGKHKYGCFCAYDTDAKRILLGVDVEDVYTHKCVKEMAISALKNSNASIAIATSGNAKANAKASKDDNKLGEVFIGIAGYSDQNKIKVATNVYNFCHGIDTCDDYNNYKKIAQISMYIRYATVAQALKDCKLFLEQNNDLTVPTFISKNRIQKDGHPFHSQKHEMYEDRKERMYKPYYYKNTTTGEFVEVKNTNNKTLIYVPNKLEIECVDIICDDTSTGLPYN